MQAKERRERHFRSNVGSMLNENYGYGYLPTTVQHQDFVYIPPNSLPSSANALQFLDKKFPESKPERIRSSSTTSDLFQAYRNVREQPLGMVHYDRDPYYWPGKDRPPSGNEHVKSNLMRSLEYIFDTNQNSRIPENGRDSVLTTPTVKSTRNSSIASPERDRTGLHGRVNNLQERILPSGRLSTENSLDKYGFKPYSPFTDTSPDFDVKQARRNQSQHISQTEEDYNTTPIPAPKYSDALNKVLDISPEEAMQIIKTKKQRPADVLKLHGHPEYPSKVMDDKDVPNYVAWAKIYPYCPLTQKEEGEKAMFVPPRGFTPSRPSRPPTQVKLRDIKKSKRNIMEGINLLSSSSRRRQQQANQTIQKNANVVIQEQSNAENKKKVVLGIGNPKQALDSYATQTIHNDKNNKTLVDVATVSAIENLLGNYTDNSPTAHAFKSIKYDATASTKINDVKVMAGDSTFYTGKTPTRTPTPNSRLHLPANRAWVKHYSPARVQRFLAAVAKNTSPD